MDRAPGPNEHGGNIAEAVARFGGRAADWLDLSTGINPLPYPVGEIPLWSWTCLPDRDAIAAAEEAAHEAYGAAAGAEVVAAAGASALILAIPRLMRPGTVAIPGPTYSEHGAAFRAAGWRVVERPDSRTTAAVIVNPNNPDGRRWEPGEILLMAEALPLLVVDESFMDLTPAGSVAAEAGRPGLVILRSFGKFHGLAGARLGFAVTGPTTARDLRVLLGPWPVSGPALAIGATALADRGWAEATRARLRADCDRLVRLGAAAGWRHVGEAGLFATFETADAAAAQAHLAGFRVWSRVFRWSDRWLRLGVPGDAAGWQQLEEALGAT